MNSFNHPYWFKVLVHAKGEISQDIQSSLDKLCINSQTVHSIGGLRERLRVENFDLVILHNALLRTKINEIDLDKVLRSGSVRSLLVIDGDEILSENFSFFSKFDDLIRTPIQYELIKIRVGNLLNFKKSRGDLICNGDFNLDLVTKDLNLDDIKINLNNFETLLIKKLVNAENYLGVERIIEIFLKEYGDYYTRNNIRVKIHRLKNKIEKQSGKKLIKNRRGSGYYLSSSLS